MRKVLIVDDHPLIRRGIALLIGQMDDLTVCGEAESSQEALAIVAQSRPDLALVDLSLKDSSGLELIPQMLSLQPDLAVLVLSVHTESFYSERAFRLGARGYVTKCEPAGRIAEAITKVLAGEIYASAVIAANVAGALISGGGTSNRPTLEMLSPRECEVFELIGQGLKNQQIAQRLHLSVKTIGAHRENIKNKLHLANATQLLSTAMNWAGFGRGS
jgi:DNA-binding NarL/FixJ family response regulator